MTVPAAEVMVALGFFRAARGEPSLQARLRRLDPALGLAGVAEVAAIAGFSVSVESLRAAHAYDWALRRARFLLDADPQDGAADDTDTMADTEEGTSRPR